MLQASEAPLPLTVWPKPQDYTQMWWAEGFPGTVSSAPWLRCIQTGRYAVVLDTRTMRIAHFGAVPDGDDYVASARRDNRAWQKLPAADLTLELSVAGKTYSCTAGGKWTQHTGPRLIASGRFLQQADVTDLVFTASDGSTLKVEARCETIAWPDRLGIVLAARPVAKAEPWKKATMSVTLITKQGKAQQQWQQSPGTTWESPTWQQVVLTCDPLTTKAVTEPDPVRVQARDVTKGAECPVTFDATYGAFRVDLDGVARSPAKAGTERDVLERVALTLTNPTGRPQTARLLFTKERSGFSVTGMSAMLRDASGAPTGIPVQLSKNWHRRPAGDTHDGQWFRGASLVHLPAGATVPLELTIAYAHWGGVAAASHAQLCLIGWGSNQQWDQSAIGSWGESMCFEPDRAQAKCLVTDVRPLMVRAMGNGGEWNWTHNVGGGDVVRLFDPKGQWVAPTRMRTAYQQQGPCLTAVTYAGRCGNGLEHATTVSLGRSSDIVRGTYRLRIDVSAAVDFSRFVIFQMGADTYSYTSERQMALGNEDGLIKEWPTQWDGNTYRTPPTACTGRIPWISLHDAVPRTDKKKANDGAWANRGLVIRAWKARLGGKEAAPWIAERGTKVHGKPTSTIDLIPPPTVKRLEAGDFVEATVEYLVLPMKAADYYGPDEALRSALEKMGNTWRLVEREAVGNDRQVSVERGTLLSQHPAVTVRAQDGTASWTMRGGLGHVPLTVTGLPSHQGWRLFCDGKAIDQSVHGNDFWQTDYDTTTRTWSLTWTVPVAPGSHRFHLERLALPGREKSP